MSREWFNLEAAGGGINTIIPDQFFEGDSAFKSFELSKKTRLNGFIACLVIGFVSSLLGSIVLLLGQIVPFAVLYVLGTIVTLFGTGFLIGLLRQIKLMFKPVRILASIVFIASIVLVLIGAFLLHNGILCLIFVIVEFLAFSWYALSYIPYARTVVLKTIGLG